MKKLHLYTLLLLISISGCVKCPIQQSGTVVKVLNCDINAEFYGKTCETTVSIRDGNVELWLVKYPVNVGARVMRDCQTVSEDEYRCSDRAYVVVTKENIIQ